MQNEIGIRRCAQDWCAIHVPTFERDIITAVIQSGDDGPIEILDHRNKLDARESLLENRDRLERTRQKTEQAGSVSLRPVTPSPSLA